MEGLVFFPRSHQEIGFRVQLQQKWDKNTPSLLAAVWAQLGGGRHLRKKGRAEETIVQIHVKVVVTTNT